MSVNEAPIPDWNKIHPDLNAKYSDLLQSHHSLCGEVAQLKEDKEALIQQRDKAYSEKDAALLQIRELERRLYEQEPRTCSCCGQNVILCAGEGCAKDMKRLNGEYKEALESIVRLSKTPSTREIALRALEKADLKRKESP